MAFLEIKIDESSLFANKSKDICAGLDVLGFFSLAFVLSQLSPFWGKKCTINVCSFQSTSIISQLKNEKSDDVQP